MILDLANRFEFKQKYVYIFSHFPVNNKVIGFLKQVCSTVSVAVAPLANRPVSARDSRQAQILYSIDSINSIYSFRLVVAFMYIYSTPFFSTQFWWSTYLNQTIEPQVCWHVKKIKTKTNRKHLNNFSNFMRQSESGMNTFCISIYNLLVILLSRCMTPCTFIHTFTAFSCIHGVSHTSQLPRPTVAAHIATPSNLLDVLI